MPNKNPPPKKVQPSKTVAVRPNKGMGAVTVTTKTPMPGNPSRSVVKEVTTDRGGSNRRVTTRNYNTVGTGGMTDLKMTNTYLPAPKQNPGTSTAKSRAARSKKK